MKNHGTTMKSDVEMLQQAEIGIQAVRSTHNLYNYIERDFDIPEPKLLIDMPMATNLLVTELATV